MVGRRKKESFQQLKEKIFTRIEGWSTNGYHKVVKKFLLNQCYRPSLPMLCRVSYYQRLSVEILKTYLLSSGGRKRIKEEGWRILNNPNSLVTKVLKAKYFPKVDFLNSSLGNNASYTWKSIWATKGVLAEGLCWRVGKCINISISRDNWIPVLPRVILPVMNLNLNDSKVAELIDSNSRTWKKELIEHTFPEDVAEMILSIPLAEKPHEDFQVWSAEASGEFTHPTVGFSVLQYGPFGGDRNNILHKKEVNL
ncbi:uncharacterized protein LOC128035332 [Gossypium raimondii]|uniref:uncharacterized protein LOC128035332 n=1 Tax=Gossypium raimondii TaxID=29730 RepID=UPI00227C9FF8|nr:uncharacterized protein LOC128035332 [Gossypium raimondii]